MENDRMRQGSVTQPLDVDLDSSEASLSQISSPVDTDACRRSTVVNALAVEIDSSDSDYIDQSSVDLTPKHSSKWIPLCFFVVVLLLGGLVTVSYLFVNARSEIMTLKSKLTSNENDTQAKVEEWIRKEQDMQSKLGVCDKKGKELEVKIEEMQMKLQPDTTEPFAQTDMNTLEKYVQTENNTSAACVQTDENAEEQYLPIYKNPESDSISQINSLHEEKMNLLQQISDLKDNLQFNDGLLRDKAIAYDILQKSNSELETRLSACEKDVVQEKDLNQDLKNQQEQLQIKVKDLQQELESFSMCSGFVKDVLGPMATFGLVSDDEIYSYITTESHIPAPETYRFSYPPLESLLISRLSQNAKIRDEPEICENIYNLVHKAIKKDKLSIVAFLLKRYGHYYWISEYKDQKSRSNYIVGDPVSQLTEFEKFIKRKTKEDQKATADVKQNEKEFLTKLSQDPINESIFSSSENTFSDLVEILEQNLATKPETNLDDSKIEEMKKKFKKKLKTR